MRGGVSAGPALGAAAPGSLGSTRHALAVESVLSLLASVIVLMALCMRRTPSTDPGESRAAPAASAALASCPVELLLSTGAGAVAVPRAERGPTPARAALSVSRQLCARRRRSGSARSCAAVVGAAGSGCAPEHASAVLRSVVGDDRPPEPKGRAGLAQGGCSSSTEARTAAFGSLGDVPVSSAAEPAAEPAGVDEAGPATLCERCRAHAPAPMPRHSCCRCHELPRTPVQGGASPPTRLLFRPAPSARPAAPLPSRLTRRTPSADGACACADARLGAPAVASVGRTPGASAAATARRRMSRSAPKRPESPRALEPPIPVSCGGGELERDAWRRAVRPTPPGLSSRERTRPRSARAADAKASASSGGVVALERAESAERAEWRESAERAERADATESALTHEVTETTETQEAVEALLKRTARPSALAPSASPAVRAEAAGAAAAVIEAASIEVGTAWHASLPPALSSRTMAEPAEATEAWLEVRRASRGGLRLAGSVSPASALGDGGGAK